MEELVKDANSRGWYICHISQDLGGKWNCQLWSPDQTVNIYRRKITPMVSCATLQEAIEESIMRIPRAAVPDYEVTKGNFEKPTLSLNALLNLAKPQATQPTFRRI